MNIKTMTAQEQLNHDSAWIWRWESRSGKSVTDRFGREFIVWGCKLYDNDNLMVNVYDEISGQMFVFPSTNFPHNT